MKIFVFLKLTHRYWWCGVNQVFPNMWFQYFMKYINSRANEQIASITDLKYFFKQQKQHITLKMCVFQSYLYLKATNRKFQRACKQILILDNVIVDTKSRYQSATTENRRSFRYCLLLKITTLERIRNMFYDYATEKAEEMEELKNRLTEMGILADSVLFTTLWGLTPIAWTWCDSDRNHLLIFSSYKGSFQSQPNPPKRVIKPLSKCKHL